MYGGIELGGTNCNCAVGLSANEFFATVRFDTGAQPTATLHVSSSGSNSKSVAWTRA